MPAGLFRSRILAAASLVLLLPIPAYALYSLGVWQVSQPQGFSWSANNSSGFDLNITPQNGLALSQPVVITFTAPVTFTSTSSNVTANTSNFNAIHNILTFGGSNAGLTIVIGFENQNKKLITADTIFKNNTQFAGNNVPSTLSPTQNVTVGRNAAFAVVSFTFSPRVTWQSASVSPISVTFTPGN